VLLLGVVKPGNRQKGQKPEETDGRHQASGRAGSGKREKLKA